MLDIVLEMDTKTYHLEKKITTELFLSLSPLLSPRFKIDLFVFGFLTSLCLPYIK